VTPLAERKPPGPIARTLLRGITKAAAHAPWIWPLLRAPVRRLFDGLAPGWDERVGADSEARLAPVTAALAHLERKPARALDIGTGTGTGAFLMASRYPSAEIVGIDLSEGMIAEARRKAERRGSGTRFEVADIASFDSAQPFDLVLMMNMPPFFEQVGGLVAPGGYVVSIASQGARTPFYTPPGTLERGFARRGLRTVAAGTSGAATYHVAERLPRVNPGRRFTVLLNPASAGGKAQRLLPEVRAALGAAGAQTTVVETQDLPHAADAARAAVERGETVVALGGDGLVGALAATLRGSAPLGVLPGGRGNDFARALGISQEIGPACQTLLDGEERALDLGEANGRAFACIASVGFDSEANRVANEARFIRGNLVYAWAAIRALVAWKPTRFEVMLDDRQLEFQGYTVAVANSAYYGGGMKVAPDADPADGLLDVIFVKHTSKPRFIANLPKVFAGTHIQLDEIEAYRAREVVVRADRQFDVYADGEPITTLPMTVKLVPEALRVIAPRS
jgi:YegS/Rv2252/BmrU family lipid kinase